MRRISSMTRSSAASASLKSPASSSTASNNDSIRSRSPGCAPSLLTSSSSLSDLAAISSLLPQRLGAYSLTPHQFESHPVGYPAATAPVQALIMSVRRVTYFLSRGQHTPFAPPIAPSVGKRLGCAASTATIQSKFGGNNAEDSWIHPDRDHDHRRNRRDSGGRRLPELHQLRPAREALGSHLRAVGHA